MDAVEFFKEWRRLCIKHTNGENPGEECKRDCPIRSIKIMSCRNGVFDNINEAIRIVEQWSKDNPRKTRLQDFLEKYPTAPVDDDGYPECICPWHLGFQYGECVGKNCKDCWNEPVE